ncbi:MAG TPA: S8 family serine peptidase [Steroidobacteraceae bacterium]|nr:S8 family serine peptidase [Steroidobacteraceae bacterium]
MRRAARKLPRTCALLLALALAGGARAQLPQVQLPPVQVPGVPTPSLPDARRALGGTLEQLSAVRRLRVEDLARAHRAELDRDPRGELVVRAEVVGIDVTEAALARAVKADFRVLRTEELPDLGVKVTVLQTPEGMSASRGLRKLRKLDPEGTYDFNHVYLDSGAMQAGATRPAAAAADAPSASGAIRVGLIDGGVDTSHVTLRGNTVHLFGCGEARVPSAHGTAVASLLAGSAGDFHGAAPQAELFAADVYCGLPAGGAVDRLAAALGWMARERVAVINVSLVGPRNALLERVVASLVSRGFLIVAAVGNDGPAAPPLYPAAYDGVMGVTAVDARHRVLIEACRGKHLDLAAPGADMSAATLGQSGQTDAFASVRGTSFAAPIVAGLLARTLARPDSAARDQAVAALAGSAEDLGPRGRDDIYGAGLVGTDVAPLSSQR